MLCRSPNAEFCIAAFYLRHKDLIIVQYIDVSWVLPFTAEKRIFASEYKHSTEDAKNKKIHIVET